jgi:hypothetical protein
MRRPHTSLLATLAITVSMVATLAAPASALSGSQFAAGRIIDDFVFNNASTMSVQDIQNFLNAKVPSCDSWGTQQYAGTTRAAYSRARGYKMPLTCLRDYYENPNNLANNLTVTDGQAAPIPAGAESAAQLIKEVSVQYNINPQVLLVLLQKEQGLTTDDWPWPTQFQKATGYACPDTAPCDTQYYGFYNQIASAAWQYNQYASHPTSYNFRGGITRSVAWSPNGACGGANVTLQNQATAGLYNYTPYQPNAAALANLTGTGDGCSSYGNRNFWYYFSTWFGTTYANDTGTPHPDGTLISGWGGVYLVQGGQRHYVSLAMFNDYGYSWAMIKPASTGDVNLPEGSPVSTVAPGSLLNIGDGTVYVADYFSGTLGKQAISAKTFSDLGFNWGRVIALPAAQTPSTVAGLYANTRHPAGSLVVSDNTVYVLNQSTKSYLTPASFLSYNYQWQDIMTATAADVALPTDGAASFRQGAMLFDGNGIYVVGQDGSGSLKQPVGPWECYSDRLHYTPSDWITTPTPQLPTRTGSIFTC